MSCAYSLQTRSPLETHDITQRCGPSKYNSGLLGAQSETKSPYATFQASNCCIMRAHRTRDER